MYIQAVVAVAVFSAAALGSPIDARQNPSATRGNNPQVDVPITPEQAANLNALGLAKRGVDGRDITKSQCGHLVTGTGGTNGHGVWVPVATFKAAADNYCSAYLGTVVHAGHSATDQYDTNLTNQKNDALQGPGGVLVFSVYNQAKPESKVAWSWDYNTCLQAMLTPLAGHTTKRDADGVHLVNLGKRDDCWGHKHNDYKGGYSIVTNIANGPLAIGSEVYSA